MTLIPRGKTALITGGSKGLGLQLAKQFIQYGIKTVITSRHETDLTIVKKQLNSPLLETIVWDISDISHIDSKLNECIHLLGGRVDILINNAGVYAHESKNNKLLFLDEKHWDSVMNINLKGAFFIMQAVLKHMIDNSIKGNILNICSSSAFELVRGPYYISKLVLAHITQSWGRFFASSGVVINGVAPGPMATGMNNWVDGDPLDFPRMPTGRMCNVEEVSDLVCFLLSESGVQIVGEVVLIDGGWSKR